MLNSSSSMTILPMRCGSTLAYYTSLGVCHDHLLFMRRTGLDSIAALLAPGRLVKEFLESLLVSVELLLENMQAFETVFANGDKLSVKSLKGFEGAGFGHGQDSGEDWRMAVASGWVPPKFAT